MTVAVELKKKTIRQFQTEIFTWYAEHQRDLPWRRDRDPYHIFVSEIMLQQTQVNRVIPKYEAWLKAFPTVESLAKAKTAEVLRLWSGLGYNRRALYLQRAAQAVEAVRIKNYESGIKEYWPRSVTELKQLPGIGEYTARAIACFAFDEQIAVVDTNIRKVILTKFGLSLRGAKATKQSHIIDETILRDRHALLAMTENEIQEIAEQLLPKGKAYEWNQALMDYASAMLKQEKIPIPKQSKFKGSNRYYRGQTVKLLLEYKGVSIKYLGKKLEKEEGFIRLIISGLEKDGLVVVKEDTVFIA